ncbi:MAG: hypothetical protein AAGA03_03315 [Planctomycetota bacterium]
MNSVKRLVMAMLCVAALSMAFASTASAGDCCAPEPVCCEPCPPPPVTVDLCVVDPVTCCKYPVKVCVPAECACEAPCYVGCKRGFLGRKILTYKWPCCGHCVEVVITKFGRVIVR